MTLLNRLVVVLGWAALGVLGFSALWTVAAALLAALWGPMRRWGWLGRQLGRLDEAAAKREVRRAENR